MYAIAWGCSVSSETAVSQLTQERSVVPGTAGKFYLAEKLYFCDDGYIICYVSEDQKTVQIRFGTEKNGLTKSEVKGLIGALKRIREAMVR
jgi:hypothetical protein